MFTTIDPKTIERVPVYEDDVEKNLRGEVLAEAYKNFGYVADSFDAQGPLAKTLSKLSITPLKTEEVDSYKTRKEREYKTHPVSVFNFCTAAAVVLINIIALHLIKSNDAQGTFCFLSLVAWGFLLMITHGIVKPDFLDAKQVKIYWKEFSFTKHKQTDRFINPMFDSVGALIEQRYEKYIPVHVLNVANQLVKELPDVTLTIEELTRQENRIPKPQPDPFLVAMYGSEKYYIEVWDEREYEKRM